MLLMLPIGLVIQASPFRQNNPSQPLVDAALQGLTHDARFEQCTTGCQAYVPHGLHYDCKEISDLKRKISTSKPLLRYGPERDDGVGACAFARVCVMVLAEALGFRYVYTPLSVALNTKTFGPIVQKAPIDWENFLNMGGSGWTQPSAGTSFVPIENIGALVRSQKASSWEPEKGYEIPHGYTLLDHPCWHKHLWKAYAKVGSILRKNYAAATVARPACPYSKDPDTIDVAIHMRRGDVMKGDPERLTRCGKPIFPNGLPSQHPRWKS